MPHEGDRRKRTAKDGGEDKKSALSFMAAVKFFFMDFLETWQRFLLPNMAVLIVNS
jgi:hypothetical protein